MREGHFTILLLSLVVALLSAGCAGKQRWYKPGATQADFNRDVRECEIIAHQLAREATIGGRHESLDTFIKVYNNCIFQKGWSTFRPDSSSGGPKAGQGVRPLARLENNLVSAFGKRIEIPSGFKLLRQNTGALGPTLMHSMFFKGPGPVFMNFIFQESHGLNFEPADYPVEPPFFLYDRGVLHGKDNDVRWTVFCGQVKGDWVVGIGSFCLISKQERIIMITTSPLPPQVTPPPQGLRLNRRQRDAVDKFEERITASLARW